jgi:hypothetical protein
VNTNLKPATSLVIECSIPEGMTISEYRRSRPSKPSRWQRLTGRSAR